MKTVNDIFDEIEKTLVDTALTLVGISTVCDAYYSFARELQIIF